MSLTWQLCFPGLLPGEAAQPTLFLRHMTDSSRALGYATFPKAPVLSSPLSLETNPIHSLNQASSPLPRGRPAARAFAAFPFRSVLVVHITLHSPAINLNPALYYSWFVWRRTLSFVSQTGTLESENDAVNHCTGKTSILNCPRQIRIHGHSICVWTAYLPSKTVSSYRAGSVFYV